MATDIVQLVEQAQNVQRKLVDQGLLAEAQVIEELVKELTSLSPQISKAFYTTSEAATLVGVTGQTIKNWVMRGLLKGFRLGGRIVIPRDAIDDYRALAEKAKAIDPLPSRDEVVEAVRRGRRPIKWPEAEEA